MMMDVPKVVAFYNKRGLDFDCPWCGKTHLKVNSLPPPVPLKTFCPEKKPAVKFPILITSILMRIIEVEDG